MIQFLPRFSLFAFNSRARRSFGVNRMLVVMDSLIPFKLFAMLSIANGKYSQIHLTVVLFLPVISPVSDRPTPVWLFQCGSALSQTESGDPASRF